MNEEFEEPERRGDEELPPLELKILPDNLKYRFLDNTNRFPVIISAKLSGEEEELMKVLKEHRKAFGYSMDDLKGIRTNQSWPRSLCIEPRKKPL